MNKKDFENHKIVATNMSWEQLTEIIIDLEFEKIEFKDYLTKKQWEKYDKLLKIYEDQKRLMVEKMTPYLPWEC